MSDDRPKITVPRRSPMGGGPPPDYLAPGELWIDVKPGSPSLYVGDGQGRPSLLAGAASPLDIAALFQDGTPGDFFVARKSLLFQDRDGIVPVTAAGQSVRAFRGEVNGMLFATEDDDIFATYIEYKDVGYLRSGNAMIGIDAPFVLKATPVEIKSIYGSRLDNHGFTSALIGKFNDAGDIKDQTIGLEASSCWQYLMKPLPQNPPSMTSFQGFNGNADGNYEECAAVDERSAIADAVCNIGMIGSHDGTNASVATQIRRGSNVEIPGFAADSSRTLFDNYEDANEISSEKLARSPFAAMPPLNMQDYENETGQTHGERVALFISTADEANFDHLFRAMLLLGKPTPPGLHHSILNAMMT